MKKTKPARCRHRRTWLVAAGYMEWCYECGVFRTMEQTSATSCKPMSAWCVPVGAGADNPFDIWYRRSMAYRMQHVF